MLKICDKRFCCKNRSSELECFFSGQVYSSIRNVFAQQWICEGEEGLHKILDLMQSPQVATWTSLPSAGQIFWLKNTITAPISSAQRVGFFNIGSGRVLDKILGSRSGSGRVGVSKYTIGYFRVSFLLSGIPWYFGYFRVFRAFPGMSGIFGHFWVYIFVWHLLRAEKIATKPNWL